MPILKAKASKGKIKEAIAYVLDKAKSTLRAVLNMDAEEDYAKQMERTARMWRKDKTGSRMFYHFKLAFHPDDSDRNGGPLDDWTAIQIATKLVKQFFPGYHLRRKNNTRHIAGNKSLVCADPFFFAFLHQIRILDISDNLHTAVHEMIKISCQLQGRPVNLRNRDEPVLQINLRCAVLQFHLLHQIGQRNNFFLHSCLSPCVTISLLYLYLITVSLSHCCIFRLTGILR